MTKHLKGNIMIFALVFSLIILGLNYTQFQGAGALFYPSAGVVAVLLFLFRKKYILGIVFGVFFGNIIFRGFQVEEAFEVSIALSFLFLLSNLLEAGTFVVLTDKAKIKFIKGLDSRDMLSFLGIVTLAGIVGGVFGILSLGIFYGFANYFTSFLYWTLGSAIGILVFGSLTLNIYLHDEPFMSDHKKDLQGLAYILLFTFVVILIFGDYDGGYVTFQNFQVLIFAVYMIAAFSFSYRMIFMNNIILMIILNILLLSSHSSIDYTTESLRINLMIILISVISSIVRIILLEREENMENMLRVNYNMEQLIVSTNKLLEFDTKYSQKDVEFNHEYIKKMFNILCDLYPNFDSSSCYVKDGDKVKFLDARGFDLDYINELGFQSNAFVWTIDTPDLIQNTNYVDVFQSEVDQSNFVNKYGKVKASIRFTILTNDGVYAGMSFDIIHGSQKQFTKLDIDNYTSFQKLINSYYRFGTIYNHNNKLKDDLVLSLVRTLEIYDKYTGGHSENVAKLAVNIAKILELSNEDTRNIYWAGIVHDIGKIGIPESIINKKGRLTKEEYALIKEHPEYGYKILNQSDELAHIAIIVKHHHEWWDGSGYPNQLSKDEIPYLSQILHVCDAVDAMARDRVYHEKKNSEEIIRELQRGMGGQFSPKIAEIMIKYIQEGNLY